MSFRFVLSLRAYTPQGYKTPTAEKTRPVRAATATPTSSQLSAIPLSSSAPKSMYGKSRQTTWLTEDGSFTSSSANTTSSSDGSSKKYVSRGTSKSKIQNVFLKQLNVMNEPVQLLCLNRIDLDLESPSIAFGVRKNPSDSHTKYDHEIILFYKYGPFNKT